MAVRVRPSPGRWFGAPRGEGPQLVIVHGRDEMMELWKNVILPMAESGTAFVDNMIFDGEYAAVIAGGKMMGKDTLVCEDYHVRDGRIVRIRVFWHDPSPVVEAANAFAASSGTA